MSARSRLLVAVFWLYSSFLLLLYRAGLRGWWLNEFPRLLLPVGLRLASARAYSDYAAQRSACGGSHE